MLEYKNKKNFTVFVLLFFVLKRFIIMGYHLGKNIVATVTYYDVMDFPLTAFEIWKHLLVYDRDRPQLTEAVALSEVWTALHDEHLAKKISEKNGLYFLKGRAVLVAERTRREKISVAKLKRMRRLARVLAYVPYVRMIGATGSLAMKHGIAGSDWDMFVVLRTGKIWIGRTFLTLFLHGIGKRRHGKKIVNRACLNYFVTEDNLEISTKDLFSAHEYRFLIPLLSFSTSQAFERKNSWIQSYKPNFSLTLLPSHWLVRETAVAVRIRSLFERLCDTCNLERWLSSWQKKKIAMNPKSRFEGSLIEANDHALVFLPRPRGPYIFQKFKERLSM